MFLNLILKVVYPVVTAVVAWSDRQQQIYEEYQSPRAKLDRMVKAVTKQFSKEELAAIDARIERQRA